LSDWENPPSRSSRWTSPARRSPSRGGRRAGRVTLDPPQFKVYEDYRDGANSPWSNGWKTPELPPDGRWVITATFDEPGTYTLRCLAHDGGLATSRDVVFTVTP